MNISKNGLFIGAGVTAGAAALVAGGLTANAVAQRPTGPTIELAQQKGFGPKDVYSTHFMSPAVTRTIGKGACVLEFYMQTTGGDPKLNTNVRVVEDGDKDGRLEFLDSNATGADLIGRFPECVFPEGAPAPTEVQSAVAAGALGNTDLSYFEPTEEGRVTVGTYQNLAKACTATVFLGLEDGRTTARLERTQNNAVGVGPDLVLTMQDINTQAVVAATQEACS